MPHNGVGALREALDIGGDLPSEAALQPFRGKLNRGQRVLDLMRDPSRHIRPGRLALRGEQLGHVIEGDDKAVRQAAFQLGADPHQQHPLAHRRAVLDLGGGRPFRRRHHCGDQRPKFRHHLGQRLADLGDKVDPQQLRRRAVRQFDPAPAVEPDHPRRDTGQHRFSEPAPLVELAIGRHQLGPLRRQLPGHPVEGA